VLLENILLSGIMVQHYLKLTVLHTMLSQIIMAQVQQKRQLLNIIILGPVNGVQAHQQLLELRKQTYLQ
jgi:hypothetical protein